MSNPGPRSLLDRLVGLSLLAASLSVSAAAQTRLADVAPASFASGAGDTGGHYGLWTSDLTSNGTREIAQLHVMGRDSDPRGFLEFGGRVAFSATDPGGTGREIWLSDGTPAGTALLADASPGSLSSAVQGMVSVGGMLWFDGYDQRDGRELYRSDGTVAGTGRFVETAPGFRSGSPHEFASLDDRLLLFRAQDAGLSGNEPWVSDGTLVGTHPLADLWSGPTSSDPGEFTQLGSLAVFAASNRTAGRELFVTDGTSAGTGLLLDLYPGWTSNPEGFVKFGSRALFVASTAPTGRELFVTDGTAAGTTLAADAWTGSADGLPEDVVVAGDLVFFTAESVGVGRELWVGDGTPAGSRLVVDLVPGAGSSGISDLTAVGLSRVVFFFDDGTHGLELWTSDGTAAGTVLVRDVGLGARAGVVRGTMARAGEVDRVFFAASDGGDGLQVWTSDGTSAGTSQVGRIGSAPGVGASEIDGFVLLRGLVWFVADDGETGREPWVLSPRGMGLAMTARYGEGCPGTGGRSPGIAVSGVPRIGRADFAVGLQDGRPASPAALNLALARADLAFDLCRILVQPPVITHAVVTTSGTGAAMAPFPVPAMPSLLGASLFAQWAVLDPAGSAFGLVTLSDGVELVLGH